MEINSTEMIKENDGDIKSGSLDRRTCIYETVLPSLIFYFSAYYNLIPRLLLTKKLGRSLGTRLMHCSEVQKQTQICIWE